jgi:hypothetical protein
VKRPAQKYPLVEVWWDDATHLELGWKTAEEFKAEVLQPEIVMSVGFLIAETPDHVVIAMDVDKEGQHNQRGQIPRSMVKRMRVIRKPDQPKTPPAAKVET